MKEKLNEILSSALKSISEAKTAEDIEQIKIQFLGKKSEFNNLMKTMKDLPAEERPLFGKSVNDIKEKITHSVLEKEEALKEKGVFFDPTLPCFETDFGTKHPLTIIIDQVCGIFSKLGFDVVQGKELEEEWFNFDALNVPTDHTSRDEKDTFYLDLPKTDFGKKLLRCHTSPQQIRMMKNAQPPIAVVSPGRVYRPDNIDASHCYMFHQIEGFAVAENLNMSNLKGVLLHFVKELFGTEIKLRFRPSFFPFTEPSAEVDISCIICKGKGCSVCKRSGWLEVLGCGMIHPNVLKNCGIDSEKYRGFAFGMGVERIAMLKYGIDDIRLFYENDVRFLNQFADI